MDVFPAGVSRDRFLAALDVKKHKGPTSVGLSI
nr:MAG TPA: hypothetical protein [Caudoviricetes sp.]